MGKALSILRINVRGPLSKCTEKEKVCNLISFVGDIGHEIYLTFQRKTVGSGKGAQCVSEKDILEREFKAHLEAKKNPIMAAVKFDGRRQLQRETFDPGRGTLGISGWGCAARTLEPLAYTRASYSWILLPYTRVTSPNHRFPSEFRFLTVNNIQ